MSLISTPLDLAASHEWWSLTAGVLKDTIKITEDSSIWVTHPTPNSKFIMACIFCKNILIESP